MCHVCQMYYTFAVLILHVEMSLLDQCQGFEICVFFFDIQKAFDTVPHLLLLQKLNALNVNPYLMRWLGNYLTNRS